VTVPPEKLGELVAGDSREHGRSRDLVTVQVKDRQYGPVGYGVQEFVGMPAGREGAGLRLAVADYAAHEQVGIVEGCAARVRSRVTELAALVDAAWGFGRDVARDAARKGKLFEEALEAELVLRYAGINFAVRSLEIRVGDEPRPAVARPRDVNRV